MVSKTGIMRNRATIIKHREGFFLALNGDLNDRVVVINGFVKGLSTVKQYYQKISKTNGAGYSSYLYEPHAIVTSYDLSKKCDIESLDEIWNPSTHIVDLETGEIIKYNDNKIIFSVNKDDTDIIETEPIINKSETMKTNEKPVVVEETVNDNNATLNAQIEAEVEAKAQAQAEYIKQQTEKTGQTKTNNNDLNSNKMNTENQNAQPVSAKRNRFKNGMLKTIETAVTLSTDVLIQTCYVASDMACLTAEGIAWGQATVVKPLGLHPDATRAELKEEALKRAERRNARIYKAPLYPVVKTKEMIAAQREKRANQTIVDAEIVS